MEEPFYKDRLCEQHGLRVLIPKQEERDVVHRIIYEELCLGRVLPESRAAYRRIISDLVTKGAEAVILGCTEISLLVGPQESRVPLFDTTSIHARKAAEWALSPT